MDDLSKLAAEYIKLINSPVNGWGQHVHPIYGRSDVMLLKMFRTHGQEKTNDAIDAVLASQNPDSAQHNPKEKKHA